MGSVEVSLAKCAAYETEAVRTAVLDCLGPLGGIRRFVKPGERILLKPNLVTFPDRNHPACTHPVVVAVLGALVREAGGHPFIGDSPALGSALSVASKAGLLEATERYGIPVVPLRSPVTRSIRLGGKLYHLTLSQDALEADGIINLPKFKAHRQATLTFGVKNLYGCVPGKRKAFRHFASGGDRDWFSNMLIANSAILSPRLTLVDAVVAMEGQGPVKGTPRGIGCLIAGTDTVAVDTICCRLVNYPPHSLCTIRAARRLGVGVSDPSSITVRGESVTELTVTDFRFAVEIPVFFSLPHVLNSCFRSWREKLAPS